MVVEAWSLLSFLHRQRPTAIATATATFNYKRKHHVQGQRCVCATLNAAAAKMRNDIAIAIVSARRVQTVQLKSCNFNT